MSWSQGRTKDLNSKNIRKQLCERFEVKRFGDFLLTSTNPDRQFKFRFCYAVKKKKVFRKRNGNAESDGKYFSMYNIKGCFFV